MSIASDDVVAGTFPPSSREAPARGSVAADCRVAALSFMSGVAGGWDKRDLVAWLMGPYARATRFGVNAVDAVARRSAPPPSVPSVIRPSSLETLLTITRGRVLASLEKAALADGALDFAPPTIERGLVRCMLGRDADTTWVAWVPVQRARLRLVDRVRALFVADALDCPEDYRSLYVCHRCESVVFDESARQLGMCNAHRRMSVVVPKAPRVTLAGEGDGGARSAQNAKRDYPWRVQG